MAEDTSNEPPKRRQSITPPPPVLGWANEIAFLEEVGAELAITFWRMLRKVRAWAETPPEERAGLFELNRKAAQERLGYACVRAPELVEAFGTFAFLIRAPHLVQPAHLAGSCREVHAWAEERSLVHTAMLFAEAAAVADPDDPALANLAGRMCRRAACDERSASWFHRAFGLSVKTKNRTEVIRGLLGYGALMKDLGEHEEARRYYEKAAQRAINTGRRRQAAEAHHEMLVWCAEIGAFSEGYRHAKLALDLYPRKHLRIPALVHDYAYFLVKQSYFTPAVTLLERAIQFIQRPEEQAIVWSTLAWAGAGLRRRHVYDQSEAKTVSLIGLHDEYAPAALIHLAHGSRSFGEWEKAERYASMAVDIARCRKDAALEKEGAGLLEMICQRELAPPEAEPTNRERSEYLIRRLKARLNAWTAPAHRRAGAELDISGMAV